MITPPLTRKALLIVLDGFGEGKNYPFNAIINSKMPFYREIGSQFPRSKLLTSGEAVGLPNGIMGNSEVGHTNIGSGRIVYQDLTRIQKSIREKEFETNPVFRELFENVNRNSGRLHVMGLMSDAGVHSHLDHLFEIIRISAEKVPMTLHLFTDGRDTPPTSGLHFLTKVQEFIKGYPNVVLGSIGGRYFAMDRDNRWDRVELAWRAMTATAPTEIQASGNATDAALDYIRESYAKNTTDEFILPMRFKTPQGRTSVEDSDGILFFNYRADRAREITRAFTEPSFTDFIRPKNLNLASFVCMAQYDKSFTLPVLFPPQNLKRIMPDLFAERGLRQFRIAETEKYAHVTFFFNGGKESPYPGEERMLIPSPKDVPTYDLKPEMSAFEIANNLSERLIQNENHFYLVNFANPDMVGHTGNYSAAVRALEAVDQCLRQVVSSALKSDVDVFLTADHGNIEEMVDCNNHPHTQHTLNPVPFHLISKKSDLPQLEDGILANVAPTILDWIGIAKPEEMTSNSLLKRH